MPTHWENLLNSYLAFYDWFETKQTSVWFQINRNMVNTIWILVDFRKDFEKDSHCIHAQEWNSVSPYIKFNSINNFPFGSETKCQPDYIPMDLKRKENLFLCNGAANQVSNVWKVLTINLSETTIQIETKWIYGTVLIVRYFICFMYCIFIIYRWYSK